MSWLTGIQNLICNTFYSRQVVPTSIASDWSVVRAAGTNGPNHQDAAAVTNPGTQITGNVLATGGSIPFGRQDGLGTTLELRLGYDAALDAVTNPIFGVFGRYNDGQAASTPGKWERLRNLAGTTAATTTAATASDLTDGVLKYTSPDDTAKFDCNGCTEFLVGIETALYGTGTVTNSIIEAKFI